MKVLKTVRWSLALMGYHDSQQRRFGINQKAYTLVNLLFMISLCVYLYHGANSAQEYIFSIFMLITIVGIFVSFVDTSNKAELIFLFIEKVQKIIDDGERKTQLERISFFEKKKIKKIMKRL